MVGMNAYYNYKNQILIGIAIACVLIVLVVISKVFFLKHKRDVAEIVVAAVDLESGSPVTYETIAKRTIPKHLLSSGVVPVDDLERILENQTKAPLYRGDFIRWSDISLDGTNPFASAIPKGMRAIAVPRDPLSAVAGQIRQGDKIDILGTFEGVPGKGSSTTFVLQDVPVLSVGKVNRQNQNSDPIILAVTPKSAAVLTFARTHGELTYILRNSKDEGKIKHVKRITTRDLPGFHTGTNTKIKVIRPSKLNRYLYD